MAYNDVSTNQYQNPLSNFSHQAPPLTPPPAQAPPGPPPRARPGAGYTSNRTNTPTYNADGSVSYYGAPAGAPPAVPNAWGHGSPPPPPGQGPAAPQAPVSPYGVGYNMNGTTGAGEGYYGAAPPPQPGQPGYQPPLARRGVGHF
jgi:hypothetical protein